MLRCRHAKLRKISAHLNIGSQLHMGGSNQVENILSSCASTEEDDKVFVSANNVKMTLKWLKNRFGGNVKGMLAACTLRSRLIDSLFLSAFQDILESKFQHPSGAAAEAEDAATEAEDAVEAEDAAVLAVTEEPCRGGNRRDHHIFSECFRTIASSVLLSYWSVMTHCSSACHTREFSVVSCSHLS